MGIWWRQADAAGCTRNERQLCSSISILLFLSSSLGLGHILHEAAVAMSLHAESQIYSPSDDARTKRYDIELVDEMAGKANVDIPRHGMVAPVLVAAMSAEHRAATEKRLVRKVDARLLPPVIIMYIMNYLDRNNM